MALSPLSTLTPTIPQKCLASQGTPENDYDKLTFFISLFLALGIVISYLPQHYRIIARKSSEGISPYFLLLGGTSSSSAFLNILILQKDIIECCRFTTKWSCFVQSLGMIQVALQWTMFSIIIILFLIYFPTRSLEDGLPHDLRQHHGHITPEHHVNEHSHHIPRPGEILHSEYKPSTYRTAVSVTVASAVYFILGSIISIIFLNTNYHQARVWAAWLGVLSMILAAMQYLPQLWVTWRIKRVASLSIPMMCMQSPGSFLFAYSLAAREGTNWSSWITYLCTGILQAVLLGMCIAWRVRERREDRKGKGVARDVDERTALLESEA